MNELPMARPEGAQDVPCCGSPPSAPASSKERPGYSIEPFVSSFASTPVGDAPVVRTSLSRLDRWGTLMARLGPARDRYRIAPGLYAVGRPGPDDPVVVTANYKLTFDLVRRNMDGLSAWLLVLDTRGINVWCAAGKALFGTDELLYRLRVVGLAKVVNHRELILPQLAATGVSARAVKEASGFRVVWGPVRIEDLKAFLDHDRRAEPPMRRVTFSLAERLVLTPMEFNHTLKPAVLAVGILFVLSGIGPGLFSWSSAVDRGLIGGAALLAGLILGIFVTAALLPVLPGAAFSVKGAQTGLAGGLVLAGLAFSRIGWLGGAGLLVLMVVISSFLAMNFTGSTPFTSPSGVEKEMRRAIPLQALGLLAAASLWVGSAFVG